MSKLGLDLANIDKGFGKNTNRTFESKEWYLEAITSTNLPF
jgi:hypothetical protein